MTNENKVPPSEDIKHLCSPERIGIAVFETEAKRLCCNCHHACPRKQKVFCGNVKAKEFFGHTGSDIMLDSYKKKGKVINRALECEMYEANE